MRQSSLLSNPSIRKVVAKVHRWFGICIGLNAATLCITGAILIYGEDIDTMLNPHLRSAAATGPMIAPEKALDAYRQARPGVAIDRIYTPQGSLGTYRLRTGPKSKQFEAFVNPYTGEFLGERVRDETLLRKIANLHISLLWAPIGRSINGFTALAGLWILFTGLFVWWPRTKAQIKERLTVKRKTTPRRRIFDLHNVAGIYALPILAAALTTGFMWAFEDFTDSMFGVIGGKPRSQPPAAVAPTGAPLLSDSQILAISQTQAPTSHLVKYMNPTAKNKIAEVHREWEDGDQYGHKLLTYIDAETGKIVDKDDSRIDNFGTNLSRLVRPFHRGLWGGNITRALWACAGCVPLFLFITGIIKVRQRRRSKLGLDTEFAVVETYPTETDEKPERITAMR